MPESTPDALVHEVKVNVGRRLRFARTHHPNGSMTQAVLSEVTGVSTRALGDIEAGNANPSLETLVRITAGLGIQRMAYLLDETVFDAVNRELETVMEHVKAKAELGVTSIAFRSNSDSNPSTQDITRVLQHLQNLVTKDHDGGSAPS